MLDTHYQYSSLFSFLPLHNSKYEHVKFNTNNAQTHRTSQQSHFRSAQKMFISKLLFLSLLLLQSTLSNANVWSGNLTEMIPLIDESKVDVMMMDETRRKLGSFQICATCTCCGGPKGYCLPSPCCYAINCNIPNRPFGFCSFTPRTCNCFNCHI